MSPRHQITINYLRLNNDKYATNCREYKWSNRHRFASGNQSLKWWSWNNISMNRKMRGWNERVEIYYSLMNWLWNAQLIAPINLSACKQVVLEEQMNWYERSLWCNRPTDPVHLLYSNAREEYLNAKSIHSVSLMIIKALMGGRGCQLAIARSDSLHSHTDILVYYYK